MEKTDRFLKVGEVAELLRVSKIAVYALCKRGDIQSFKLNSRNLRFLESDVINFIRNHCRPAADKKII